MPIKDYIWISYPGSERPIDHRLGQGRWLDVTRADRSELLEELKRGCSIVIYSTTMEQREYRRIEELPCYIEA